jgi:tRNA(Ile)-lysidine synthase
LRLHQFVMEQRPRVAVAFSGGLDSTALLYATAHEARAAGIEVLALHVHHGLLAQADAWWAHGQSLCESWTRQGLPVRFVGHRLSGQPARGESVEAWAREHRYAALAAMARAEHCTLVLLAHHENDQAETFLLQALRGSGPAGLAAMPQQVRRNGICWVRPWLQQPRARIHAYARLHQLPWVEDPSNADGCHARGRLRQTVWPVLQEQFPHAAASLRQSARWAAQAEAALAAYADEDINTVAQAPPNRRRDVTGDALAAAGPLRVSVWRAWTTERRVAVLRRWLHRHTACVPSYSLVERLMRELGGSSTGTWPCLGLSSAQRGQRWEGPAQLRRGQLRLYRDELAWSECSPTLDADRPGAFRLEVLRCGDYPLIPWRGVLRLQGCEATEAQALPLRTIVSLEIRAREGSERFTANLARPPRSLKKQFQAAGVPAWARDGPLIYWQGQLLYVPGLGLDAHTQAALVAQAKCAAHASGDWVSLQWLMTREGRNN